ncbi:hypothetical protein C8J57DRAFT_1538711 [Mycena rebaudengoi]|nr:hypothetical protein C8J57DRAFT_1538711 [Mycena rebaudengoi]
MISASEWTRKDGDYDYVKMFDKVVKLFTDHPTDPWAIETLDWYTKNVFGTQRNGSSSTGANDGSDDDDDIDSDDEAINAQRIARHHTLFSAHCSIASIVPNYDYKRYRASSLTSIYSFWRRVVILLHSVDRNLSVRLCGLEPLNIHMYPYRILTCQCRTHCFPRSLYARFYVVEMVALFVLR